MGDKIRSTRMAKFFGVIVAFLAWPLMVGASVEQSSAHPDEQFLNRVCGDNTPVSDAYAVTDAFCSMKTRVLQLADSDGDTVELPVLVAREGRQRQAGYQHIGREVIERTAVLFVSPSETRGAFHMCNVRSPLDIAWIRADGSVVDIQKMDPGPPRSPLDCPQTYAPRAFGAYRFALEAPAGYFSANGMSLNTARLVVEPWMTATESPSD